MADIQYANCSIALIQTLRGAGVQLSDAQRSLIMPTIAPFLEDAYRIGQEFERSIYNSAMAER